MDYPSGVGSSSREDSQVGWRERSEARPRCAGRKSSVPDSQTREAMDNELLPSGLAIVPHARRPIMSSTLKHFHEGRV